MRKAIGLLEVQGFSVALAAIDKACKAAEITIEGMDCNNPISGDRADIPVVVQVKISGDVADIKVALEVAKQAASAYIPETDILIHLIPAAAKGLQQLLIDGKVAKKS